MFNHKSKNNTKIVAAAAVVVVTAVVAAVSAAFGNGNFSAKTRSDSAQKRVK